MSDKMLLVFCSAVVSIKSDVAAQCVAEFPVVMMYDHLCAKSDVSSFIVRVDFLLKHLCFEASNCRVSVLRPLGLGIESRSRCSWSRF